MARVIDNTGGKAPAKPIVVSVNGVVIPRETIVREIQNHPADKPASAWQDAARALVVRELLLQETRRLGIVGDAKVDDAGRRETDDDALIRCLIEQEVRIPEPDEANCRRYYEQHIGRFRSPDVFEAAHILFAARREDAIAFADAKQRAEGILAELRQNPERFGELAARHSACPSGAQGGNLGQLTAGQTTEEFERALFALEPGCISEHAVATRYGCHIIRLDRRIEGRQLPFELVADRIAQYLREAVFHRATAQYVARLVSRANITGVALAGAEAHRVN